MNKKSVTWLISFLALTVGFYWLDQSQWFQQGFLDRLAYLNTRTTVWVLSLLGAHLKQMGSTIITESGSIEIARSCTGSFVFMVFAGAVLPFPTPWKWRLQGLLLGLMALLTLNLFRTCMIVLVGARFPQAIQTLHVIIGQMIVISGMTAVFLVWAKHTHPNAGISLFKNNRDILRAVSLFCIGYLCGFWLYQQFLESPLGHFVKEGVDIHTLWLLSFLNNTLGWLPQSSFAPIKLIDGCLSSPMVVVFAALVVAWPSPWWKRALIVLLGFIPFFYLYHLIRAVLIALTLGIHSKEGNVVYNLYGQALLILALFTGVGYAWCIKRKSISCRRLLYGLLVSGLIGFAVAGGLGWVMRCSVIPLLTGMISNTSVLAFDPEQMVSRMFDLQIFVWLSLIGLTPTISVKTKMTIAGIGICVAFLDTALAVALMEVFQLQPHKGLFKLAVVLLPFGVYFFAFLHSKPPGDNALEKA